MRLEINNKGTTGKFTKLWRLNNTLLNNKWIKEEITRKIRKYLGGSGQDGRVGRP